MSTGGPYRLLLEFSFPVLIISVLMSHQQPLEGGWGGAMRCHARGRPFGGSDGSRNGKPPTHHRFQPVLISNAATQVKTVHDKSNKAIKRLHRQCVEFMVLS